MSEKKNFKRAVLKSTLSEIRQGGIPYVEAMVKVMEETLEAENPMTVGKAMISIGYAMGVIAGKCSDVGIEGYTLLLNGINMSLEGEKRKEKMQFAIWDMEGGLHTSEEGFYFEKGGEQ